MPKFSIIITCYNHAQFIQNAVDSALSQTYADAEVIVVDDCSPDESRKVLKQYGDRIKLLLPGKNGGAATARNLGASTATGDFMVSLDGDDVLLPEALEIYARVIDARHPVMIFANMTWFQGSPPSAGTARPSQEIDLVDYAAGIKRDRWFRISAGSIVVDRQVFLGAGGFRQDAFPLDDVDLTLNLSYAGRAVLILSPPTVAWRLHSTNTSKEFLRQIDGVLQLIKKFNTGQYPQVPGSRFKIKARIGGVLLPILRRAWREKFYARSFGLLAKGWSFILAAALQKCGKLFSDRHPAEKLTAVP